MNQFEELLGGLAEMPSLSVEEVLLHLLVTFVLGQFLAWTYALTHHGMSYSRSQIQALVLLSLIVAMVMLAVGNNLARAFGLFGALALVRFRTPVKDARDTSFLFMAVGIGISVGAGQLVLAVVGTVFVAGVALYLSRTRFGERLDHNAVLRFAMGPGAGSEGLRPILQRHCETFALVQLRELGGDEGMEMAYQVTLFDPQDGSEMLADLREVPEVHNLNLFIQDGDQEP